MIPKRIHYCWFGHGDMSPVAKRCIESWKRTCPDYEILRWDETNTSFSHPVCQHAIAHKQWAFLSDYVRMDVVAKEGGVYMDVDIELIKSLDALLLKTDFFIGKETDRLINAGVFGASKNNPNVLLMKRAIEDHFQQTRRFLEIPRVITPALEAQARQDALILPKDYFYPYNPFDKQRQTKILMHADLTENTLGIHHWNKSWNLPARERWLRRFSRATGRISPTLSKWLHPGDYA